MSHARFHKPNEPNNDVPDEFEHVALPVAPDEARVTAVVPGVHGFIKGMRRHRGPEPMSSAFAR